MLGLGIKKPSLSISLHPPIGYTMPPSAYLEHNRFWGRLVGESPGGLYGGVYIYVSILHTDLNVDNPLFFCNLANTFGLESLSTNHTPILFITLVSAQLSSRIVEAKSVSHTPPDKRTDMLTARNLAVCRLA